MTPRAIAALALVTACSGTTGGGGGTPLFAPEWQNDGGKSIAAVHARVAKSALPAGAAVAVGVTSRGLVGIGLDGSGRWSHPTVIDARPAIAGDVVVATGGGSLFALDARSGKELWRVAIKGRALRGAGDDGTTTVASLGNASGGGSLLLAVSRNGKVVLDAEPDVEIGAPAAQGGVAFVPWGNQYVSALEIGSGDELGRLLMREQVSHAVNLGGTLYFGQMSLTRFDAQIAQAATGGANKVSLPERELPGKPTWFDDGTEVIPRDPAARGKIRLLARPAAEGSALGIDSDRFGATYFRVAMGFDAKDAKLAWVRTFDADVVGGAARPGGFSLCDTQGRIWTFDAAGGQGQKIELGAALEACVVQAGDVAVPNGTAPPPLSEQLAAAIQIRETEMAVAQRFLLRELGAIEDATVTKALIDIASHQHTPSFLLGDARELLAARRTGAEHMLAALERHYDFLDDVLRPPPVGPLADALAAIGEKRAGPLLASHLNDPANTPDDTERAARALAKLATATEMDELKTFFALYRATADQKELVNAVLSVAEALIRVGGDEAQRIVQRAVDDPMTHPQVKAGLANMMPAGGKSAHG
jgi:outer membrane protein assembly factor BamB